MECKFIDRLDQFKLINRIKNGDEQAISVVLSELSRLQSVIQDYERGIIHLSKKLESNTIKEPKEATSPIQ